jgi:hypothetical protein
MTKRDEKMARSLGLISNKEEDIRLQILVPILMPDLL